MTGLGSINPYFPRENGGCIYPYFFDIDGKRILDTLDVIYEDMVTAVYVYVPEPGKFGGH